MKKIIATAIIIALVTISNATALPKVTMVDYNCGNTPDYIEGITTKLNVEIDKSKPISKEMSKYFGMFNWGTWILEENGESILISLYKGKIILRQPIKPR